MAWLSVNKDGTENISDFRPDKNIRYGVWENYTSIEGESIDFIIEMPVGSIKKLIGYVLTWSDDPVEI